MLDTINLKYRIVIEGMVAENKQREIESNSMAYDEQDFAKVGLEFDKEVQKFIDQKDLLVEIAEDLNRFLVRWNMNRDIKTELFEILSKIEKVRDSNERI